MKKVDTADMKTIRFTRLEVRALLLIISEFREKLIDALIPHFKLEEFFYYTPRHSQYSWAYINFLQIGSIIFVPGLGIDEDQLAIEKLQAVYPNYKVIKIDGCQDLVRDGGALNCISWNIMSDLSEKENEVLPNTY